ncbi:MAG: pyridoxamine 5'-phosphate oxidase family protein [Acidimicrobiales bacterium]
MELDESACIARLGSTGHGVLATVHPKRGVDVVPVVFALDGRRIVIPIDTIKQKRSTDLQRSKNLRADPRCALVVEHYSEDWDDLWWVRVHANGSDCPDVALEAARDLLAATHPRYSTEGSIAAALILDPTAVSGWAAA